MTAISVIIPAWNRADQIIRAVQSVLAQTVNDLQVVVVDNASIDATAEVVEQIGDPRIVVLRLDSNRGAAGGRNAGLAIATGKYVGFLDSDDEFAPAWAEHLLKNVGDGHSLVTCGFAMMNADGSTRYEHGAEDLGPAFSGDAYVGKELPEVPKTLRDATMALDKSKLLRGVFGDAVVDHYVHTARWEQAEFDRRVTDLELMRGFEQY